jgi:flagellar hook-associated protein 2
VGLRFDPVGGGQFKQAVKAIIDAESQPIKMLEGQKSREEARMKLFQEFKAKFNGFEKLVDEISNFKKFRELKVDLGDGSNLMNVTIDKEKAEPGSYQIEIDELAARTSVISNSFEDPDEPMLGIGFVTVYTNDGDSIDLYVDDEHSSLHGIASLINSEKKSPVHASVVKDVSDPDEAWRLIITSNKDGLRGAVDFPDFYFLDGEKDFYLDDDREAQNAFVQIDGFPIEAESNDITDFLQGVNAHLKAARPDQPFFMTITEDYAKISGKVKAIVDQLNQILEFINKQNAIDEKSDTRSTFGGDTGLQGIEYRIRNLIHEPMPVGDEDDDDFGLMYANQIGIEFERSGLLTFKEDKFTRAMEKDFNRVAEAITGEDGLATKLRTMIDGYKKTGGGLLPIREQALRQRIKTLDDQIDNKRRALDRREQALVDQFSRLEANLGNLQRQQQYLTATLGSMGGNNLVQQLLGG